MPIDFDIQLLNPIYAGIGIPAQLTLDDTGGTQVDLTVLDKTQGVVLESQSGPGVSFATSKPAALVRVAELDENAVTRDSLKNLIITFNGKSWKIQSTQPKPKPGGKGELYLVLQTP